MDLQTTKRIITRLGRQDKRPCQAFMARHPGTALAAIAMAALTASATPPAESGAAKAASAALSQAGGAGWTFSRITAENGLCDNKVQHILQLPDGRMLVTTIGNINIYDGVGFHHIHHTDIKPTPLPGYRGAYHVYVDHSSRIWIKSRNRLMCFDLAANTYLANAGAAIRQLFPQAGSVADLFVDSERQLWVSDGRCLWYGRSGRRIVLDGRWGELQDVDVLGRQAYLFFGSGMVVCADLASGRARYTSRAYPAEASRLYGGTSLVRRSADGKFYQLRNGAKGIFLRFDPKTRRWATLMQTDFTLHTLALKDTRTAYFTSARGLWKTDLVTGAGTLQTSLYIRGEGRTGAASNTIFFDTQGGVWIGTYGSGLLYAHPLRFPFRTVSGPQPLWPEAGSVFTDSRGYVWKGTSDGLELHRGRQKTVIHSEDGLSNDRIHAITEDRRGRIWVSTAYGISRIAVDRKGRVRVNAYTADDGVQRGEYADGQALTTADGHIVMGGAEGLTVFSPDETDRMDRLALNPVLTRMAVNGTPLPAVAGETVLQHNENTLSLDFAALNYALPHHTVYRYTLSSGGDSTTVVTNSGDGSGQVTGGGALHLSLFSLNPGRYRLRVQASADGQHWTGQPVTVTFRVRPPWWSTWWARTLFATLALAAAGLAVAFHYRRKQAEMRQKLKEEQLLARIQGLMAQSSRCADTAGNEPPAGTRPDRGGTEADRQFLQRAITLVEQHLGTPYSVEQLSKDLCMERTGLYKRLSALADKSPSVFIRSVRLRHAARMIAEGRHTIAEIADITGFSSSSHLSKCFQEEYGCKPSEYRQKSAISS